MATDDAPLPLGDAPPGLLPPGEVQRALAIDRMVAFVAFMILAAGLALSLAVAYKLQHETLAQVCTADQETRDAVRDLASAFAPVDVPPDAAPGVADAINEMNKRGFGARKAADRIGQDPPCPA